jgi:glucoamylase
LGGPGRSSPARAQTELAAGNRAGAEQLLRALEGFASDGHLLPEQVWDAADIPQRELFRGRPSGSAMPLVWAHAEHIKLLRSLADGRVYDMPPQPRVRYQIERVRSRHCIWRYNNKCRSLVPGSILRVELLAPATVHWSVDAWRASRDTPALDSGCGVYYADLDTAALASGAEVIFTIRWADGRWDGSDYRVAVR